MHYIVLDMEWNQPFAPRFRVQRPVLLMGEIVQIGAVKLDERFQTVDTFSIMIRPKHYRRMNWRVAKLTKIGNADLSEGIPFPDAFVPFKNWCGSDFVFLTWGLNDVPMLRDNMRLHYLPDGWIPKVYNVQVIYDTQIAKERRQCSLESALERIGEEGCRSHDALNDAINTACICRHLDMPQGLAVYDETALHATAADRLCRHEFAEAFPTKAAALEDDRLRRFECPVCGEITSCGEWLAQSSDKMIAMTTCRDHDPLFVRVKLWRTSNHKVSACRMVYSLNEENEALYRTKLAQRDARAAGESLS